MSNDHHHHHDHDSHSEMPFDEKLLKLLNHWIKHNEDHALNYRNWAEKAKANDQKKLQRFSQRCLWQLMTNFEMS
jgi:hypothetical protein